MRKTKLTLLLLAALWSACASASTALRHHPRALHITPRSRAKPEHVADVLTDR
jgi:hypothetical protein